MRIKFLVPLFLLICIGIVGSDDYSDIEIADPSEPRWVKFSLAEN